MIKVAKFGGSSLGSAGQFKKVKNIVESDANRGLVVVSAVGKRNKQDNKITDLLYLCHAHLKYSVSYDLLFSQIETRYFEIKEELGLKCDLQKEFDIIRKNMTKNMNRDYLVSRGEYLAGLLMAEFLGYDFVDAADVVHFNFDGKVDIERTRESLAKVRENSSKTLIPGFYGSLPNGEVKLFSRGGSDITGAILAQCIDAEIYENWTDVSGTLVADPNIVSNPKRIEIITYSELRELSYMGANVLHTDAIAPVKQANIPIIIKNTNDPSNPGTLIVNETHELLAEAEVSPITGIAGKKDFSIVSIYKDNLSTEVGIIKKVIEIFEKYEVNIEHIPTGIDTFSVIVSTNSIKSSVYEIISEIKSKCKAEVVVSNELSLIAIVGRNMKNKPGTSGKIFEAIGSSDVNIKVISQGADEISIIIGVENKDFEKTIKNIYCHFIK